MKSGIWLPSERFQQKNSYTAYCPIPTYALKHSQYMEDMMPVLWKQISNCWCVLLAMALWFLREQIAKQRQGSYELSENILHKQEGPPTKSCHLQSYLALDK